MENIEDLPEEVFDLLSAKKYEEFSASELKLLEEYIPQKEIQAYSVLVQDFLTLDSWHAEAIGESALPILGREKEIPITKNILTRQIPLYQALAVAVVVFVVTVVAFTMFRNQTKPIAKSGEHNPKGNAVQVINNQDYKGLSADSTLNQSKGKSLLEEDYPEEIVFTL